MLHAPAQMGVSVTWASLPGKPALFPPSAHTHAFGDLTGMPATFPPAAHTHAWADITGKPASYPPATHTHSYNDLTDKPTIPPATGRLVLVGTVTVSQTLLLALGAGMVRKALPLSGIATTDRLVFATPTPCASGCEPMNVYPTAANEVTVSYNTPALGIGAVISIPLAIYRVT